MFWQHSDYICRMYSSLAWSSLLSIAFQFCLWCQIYYYFIWEICLGWLFLCVLVAEIKGQLFLKVFFRVFIMFTLNIYVFFWNHVWVWRHTEGNWFFFFLSYFFLSLLGTLDRCFTNMVLKKKKKRIPMSRISCKILLYKLSISFKK